MYKYVDSGLTDKFNLPIYKRKRIFRKVNKVTRTLTEEQHEEIKTAFYLFDRDRSNTIDLNELKDAMKALGIHLSKQQTNEMMERIDKDGSGCLELDEFIALMSEIIYHRNQELEMHKVFRFYDNDDDGTITINNIWEAADQLDLEDELNEQNVNMMIEMGDDQKKGYIDEDDFIKLMRELGVIFEPINFEEQKLDNREKLANFERAKKLMEEEKQRAIEKAELMKKKAAMGNTPALDI